MLWRVGVVYDAVYNLWEAEMMDFDVVLLLLPFFLPLSFFIMLWKIEAFIL